MFETLWLNCILFISFAERSGLRLEMRKQREGKSKGEKDEWTHLSPKFERFASCSVTWGFIFSFLHFFLWRVEQLVKMFSLHNDTCTPKITKEDAAEDTVYICILIPWLSFAMQCGMIHILWEVKHHSNYRNDFAVGRFLSVLCYTLYTNNSQMHIQIPLFNCYCPLKTLYITSHIQPHCLLTVTVTIKPNLPPEPGWQGSYLQLWKKTSQRVLLKSCPWFAPNSLLSQ